MVKQVRERRAVGYSKHSRFLINLDAAYGLPHFGNPTMSTLEYRNQILCQDTIRCKEGDYASIWRLCAYREALHKKEAHRKVILWKNCPRPKQTKSIFATFNQKRSETCMQQNSQSLRQLMGFWRCWEKESDVRVLTRCPRNICGRNICLDLLSRFITFIPIVADAAGFT